ncbi:MAG: polysaccharide deacetylase family protein [Verrucomicrobiia bacterium]
MRLDRALSLYAFRPLVGMNAVSRKRALPILMYHSISDDVEPECSPYYKTATSPARFAQHLRWLNDEGFRSVDLEEGVRLAQQGGLEREKRVLITFDDGFRDFYDSALPVLKSHNHTATVFLPTAFIGPGRQSFKGRECLTWKEVRELRIQGIQFGSHTARHPVLYGNSWVEIQNELSSSKKKLEQELGGTVTSFAYPYAFPQQDRRFTVAFKKLLQEQGYRHCVTTMIGRVRAGDDLFSLKRLPVNNCDDKPLLLAKLNGAYDWLAYPQSWFKSVRHRLGRALRKEAGLYPVAESL